MRFIPLAGTTCVAFVDDEDYERVSHLSWRLHVGKNGRRRYASRMDGGRRLYLHRVVLGCTAGDGTLVDHRNGNGLDNRRQNLRLTTNAENMRNRRPRNFGTSRYRGVDWDRRSQRWRARAKVDYKHVYLGRFFDEDEAGRAVEAFWRDFDPNALHASQGIAA